MGIPNFGVRTQSSHAGSVCKIMPRSHLATHVDCRNYSAQFETRSGVLKQIKHLQQQQQRNASASFPDMQKISRRVIKVY